MNALEVAKAVINKGLEHNSPLTHLQLQKILFIIDQRFSHVNGHPLIDEGFTENILDKTKLKFRKLIGIRK